MLADTGLSSWWYWHTTPFSQVRSKTHEAEPAAKRPRKAKPKVLQQVQHLITELVKGGWRIVYAQTSSNIMKYKKQQTKRADLGCLR